MNRNVASLAALLLLGAGAFATEKPAFEGALPGQWTMDFDAACKVASEKKLPLFLNFTGSDWCGWCKLMDKSVFSQEAWKRFAQDQVLLVWIDFPNDKTLVPEKIAARNQALAARFGVEGYPTYIVLDDDGQTQLGQLGADRDITPEVFIAKLKEVLQNRASAVEALLKTLPEKTAEEYRSARQRRDSARDELKALEATYATRSAELKKTVAGQEARLAMIREEARLAKLSPAQAESYRSKKARHEKVTAELKAWIATDPPQNDANQKKFSAWRDELSALEKEMGKLLAP